MGKSCLSKLQPLIYPCSLMHRLDRDISARRDRKGAVSSSYSDSSQYLEGKRVSMKIKPGRVCTPRVDIRTEVLYPWQLENRDPLYRQTSRQQIRKNPSIRSRTGYLTENTWLDSLRNDPLHPVPEAPVRETTDSKLRRFHAFDWGSCIRLANRS